MKPFLISTFKVSLYAKKNLNFWKKRKTVDRRCFEDGG